MKGFLQSAGLGSIFLLAGLLSASAAEQVAAPRYSKPAVRREIAAVVDAQLAAFRAKDFARAHDFAAAPLRAQLTPKAFAVTVARGYPMILHHERAELGLPMDDGARATIIVRLWAEEESVVYRYTLRKEAIGWRIAGVALVRERESDA